VHHPASRAARRTYLGQFYEGARQGVGAELLAGGEGFLGVWGAGKRHGVGRCVLPDGSIFEGEIEAGAIHGRGRMVYANGDTYIGAWVRGARHGMGLMTRLLPGTVGGADLYHGDWRDDRPGGHGSASYENGDEFAGEWVDGQRQGEGVSKCASARGPTAVPQQPATARDTAQHSPTQPTTAHRSPRTTTAAAPSPAFRFCRYADGSVYEGEWRASQRHGKGTYKSTDGSIYSGDWHCDERSGDGRQKQIVAEEPTAQVSQGRQLTFLEDAGLRAALKTFGSNVDQFSSYEA